MTLLLVGRKKYNTALNNYRVAMEGQRKLRKAYIDFQEETRLKEKRREQAYAELEDNCKQLCNRLEFYELENRDLKKEVKRLRQLCTKNGIKYDKKEVK